MKAFWWENSEKLSVENYDNFRFFASKILCKWVVEFATNIIAWIGHELYNKNGCSLSNWAILFFTCCLQNIYIFSAWRRKSCFHCYICCLWHLSWSCTISVSILFTYRAFWVLQSPRDRIMVIFVQQHHSPVDVYNGKHSNFSVLQKLKNTLCFRDM